MSFQTRNAKYLRISDSTVLQLYLYLDPAHVHWMTDHVFQKVLEDLRPRIIPKLLAESDISASTHTIAKSKSTATIDVHRGDDYQFAYFLRQTDHSHVVLVKQRNYVARPIGMDLRGDSDEEAEEEDTSSRAKGKGRARSTTAQKRTREEDESEVEEGRAVRLRGGADLEGDEFPRMDTFSVKPDPDDPSQIDPFAYLSTYAPSQEEDRSPTPPLPAQRSTLFDYGEDEEEENPSGSFAIADPEEDSFGAELEDEKMFKPVMQLSYNGFTIFSKQLCLVVEPYPLLPPSHYLPRSSSTRRSRSGTSSSTTRATSSTPFSTGDSRTPFERPPTQSRSSTSSATPFPSTSRAGSSIPNIPASSRSGGGGDVSRPPAASRAPTPLFRPQTPFEVDSDEELELHQGWRNRSVSVLPRDGGRGEGEETASGMVGLSQIVQNARPSGRETVGEGEGDDGEDGGVDVGTEDG